LPATSHAKPARGDATVERKLLDCLLGDEVTQLGAPRVDRRHGAADRHLLRDAADGQDQYQIDRLAHVVVTGLSTIVRKP